MRILRSPDRQWRLEVHPAWCRLFYLGGLVLDRVSLDETVAYLLNHGMDPGRDLIED